MKTIKQIADEIGVSKQAVRNAIAKLGLQSALQKERNQFAIDFAQESLIKQEFLENKTQSKSQSETQSSLQSEAVINTLLKQLEIKDQEIQRLHGLLEREQQIRMVEAQQKLLPSKWKFWKNRHHDER